MWYSENVGRCRHFLFSLFLMEDYITFTQINDFLFSPASLYLHSAFVDKAHTFYKEKAQVAGTIEHSAIEDGRYSTRKNVLQAKTVYCEKYKILGKIDTFDVDTGELVERKNKISKIYLGFIYQLWAQYFALREMGYNVRKLSLYSKTDNKKYSIKFPSKKDEKDFEKVLTEMRNFNVENLSKTSVDANGAMSIYGALSW